MDRLVEALEMVDAFISIGSIRFDVTRTDIEGKKVMYYAGRNVKAVKELLLPFLLPIVWELHHNLIIRPAAPRDAVLAQLDDLDSQKLETILSKAFLVIETSPNNYQGWIAIEGGGDEIVRRLVRGMGVDEVASRSVRLAGTLNVKPDYLPDFPVVRICSVKSRHRVKSGDVEHLLALPRQPFVYRGPITQGSRGWPDYGYCLRGAKKVETGKRKGEPDRSSADYFWCKWALERNNTPKAVQTKLLEVSVKAQEEWDKGNQQYVERTVKAAMHAG
jgi:hypothetical protein